MTWMVPERGLRATTGEPAVLSPPKWAVAPAAGFEPYEFNGPDPLPLPVTSIVHRAAPCYHTCV